MKDSKFIELLNLYVDHQISAEDAALLEAEIQRSPERRRVYRQYCQMQKACVLVAENFRTQAPARGKVIDFPQRSRSRMNVATYAMGVLAAAACVALVVVERSRLQDERTLPQAGGAVVAEVAARAPASPAVTNPAPMPVRAVLQPVFAGVAPDSVKFDTSLAATVPLDWMNQVQLQRVQNGELWIESRPSHQPNELIFRDRRPSDATTTLAAFRFQR